MARAVLTIDLDAIAANWRALDALTGPMTETGAVVKADGYGLGLAPVARALKAAGARSFFVALAEEGAELRAILGPGPEIWVLSGCMAGDDAAIRAGDLMPVLNSPDQLRRFRAGHPSRGFGLQLDTGLNRLGWEPVELAQEMFALMAARPKLILSHLACAEDPGHPMNPAQLGLFHTLSLGFPGVRRSLAATGGLMLGPAYALDLTRPGIGLYGGLPFAGARPVVSLSLPVIQTRDIAPGEIVGYGATYTADRPRRIATVGAGYADGIFRSLAGKLTLFAGETPCPAVGRISMDLITVDVSGLTAVPPTLDLLCPAQGIDRLAEAAGTIGLDVLTSLGSRYARVYKGDGVAEPG